jgi:hypothetical protein
MPKPTKRVVEAAGARDVDYFIWDDDLPGFRIRIFPSGATDVSPNTAPADPRAGSTSRPMNPEIAILHLIDEQQAY